MYEGMSDQELEQMYQEVILEASKAPHGKQKFAEDITTVTAEKLGSNVAATTVAAEHEYCVSAQSHQFNPTCGDEVTVRVELSDGSDGKPIRIENLIWDGQGCSISQASLSIMYDLVHDKTLDDAMKLSRTFKQLMESRGAGLEDEDDTESLEDAVVFQGVSKYPMRIKCALLGWEGLKDSAALALTQMKGEQ
ncbi:Fe-S cluster assembly sulfur transfer protein SufU [Alloscardovia venturai]|uniref:Fe-S cluster assembly sulfur transfer protein SufU n=1 Tax=Alloscardovia venturai TaxID=1769421 RepID=A0ABW2Y8A2_9BIFI